METKKKNLEGVETSPQVPFSRVIGSSKPELQTVHSNCLSVRKVWGCSFMKDERSQYEDAWMKSPMKEIPKVAKRERFAHLKENFPFEFYTLFSDVSTCRHPHKLKITIFPSVCVSRRSKE